MAQFRAGNDSMLFDLFFFPDRGNCQEVRGAAREADRLVLHPGKTKSCERNSNQSASVVGSAARLNSPNHRLR